MPLTGTFAIVASAKSANWVTGIAAKATGRRYQIQQRIAEGNPLAGRGRTAVRER